MSSIDLRRFLSSTVACSSASTSASTRIGLMTLEISALYIDDVCINIVGVPMALQIANPSVVGKVERLAKQTGLSKTAVVERAVDRMLSETASPSAQATRMAALLAQLDRIPDRSDASSPLEWDDLGLPR